MVSTNGERMERVPAYIKRVTQDLSSSTTYDAVFWQPETAYVWKHKSPSLKGKNVRVYEAHGNHSLQYSL
jgi:1,4-alpha-glucan branching enzyme